MIILEPVLCPNVVLSSSCGVCVCVLQDVMSKVRSDILLDMNMEKSRVKEMVRDEANAVRL